MKGNKTEQFKRIIRWLLLAITIVYLISGYGITEYRVIETITLGLLTKSLSFKLHSVLLIPFLALLAVHILTPAIVRLLQKNKPTHHR